MHLQGYYKDLLPTIKQYIWLRRSLIAQDAEGAACQQTPPKPESPTFIQDLSGPPDKEPLHQASPTKDTDTPAPQLKTAYIASLSATPTPTPTHMSLPPNLIKPPQTTREMLEHTAWLSEEVLRASEEKVNLAQAAYDSVRLFIHLE